MNRLEIKKWLLDAGLTMAQIGREAGVSKALVSLVIKGQRSNELVKRLLRDHGCPPEYMNEVKAAKAA